MQGNNNNFYSHHGGIRVSQATFKAINIENQAVLDTEFGNLNSNRGNVQQKDTEQMLVD